MGLLSGGFATGFIEGFADSVSDAIEKDMDRVNKRVERISELKMKRALKDQEERDEKLKEVTEALAEAEALFGSDDPRAASYAASLLKEQGSVTALRSFVKEIKGSDQYKSGQNMLNFMEQQEKEIPTGTRSDYARAFIGPAKTISDYRLPEGMADEGAGNLLSALGIKQDVSGRVASRVKEELSAYGIKQEVSVPDIKLPTMKFMREKFTISNMSPKQRLDYFTIEMNKPENSDRVDYFKGKVNEQLKIVSKVGGLEDKRDATVSMFKNSQDPKERKQLSGKIIALNDEIDIEQAIMSGDTLKKIEVDIRIAQRNNDIPTIKKLMLERDRLSGKEETSTQVADRLEKELQSNVANGNIKEGTPEFNTAAKEIYNLRETAKAVTKATTPDKEPAITILNSNASFIDDEVDAALEGLPELAGKDYLTAVNLVKNKMPLNEALQEAYTLGQSKITQIREQVYDRLLRQYPENIALKGIIEGRRSGATKESTIVDPSQTPPAVTDGSVDDTMQDVDTVTNVAPDSGKVLGEGVTIDIYKASRVQFPNTVEGATAYFKAAKDDNEPLEEARADAIALGYSDAFLTKLAELYAPVEIPKAEQILKFIQEESYGTSSGRKNLVISEIAEKEKISIEEATKLYNSAIELNRKKVSEALQQNIEKAATTSRRRRRRRSRGGLMSKDK
jgi:hypothetical protein